MEILQEDALILQTLILDKTVVLLNNEFELSKTAKFAYKQLNKLMNGELEYKYKDINTVDLIKMGYMTIEVMTYVITRKGQLLYQIGKTKESNKFLSLSKITNLLKY